MNENVTVTMNNMKYAVNLDWLVLKYSLDSGIAKKNGNYIMINKLFLIGYLIFYPYIIMNAKNINVNEVPAIPKQNSGLLSGITLI